MGDAGLAKLKLTQLAGINQRPFWKL
jgi:hypothetical protein